MFTRLDRLGWRGKVGIILPSANTVTEPVFYSLAPQGISFHTSRTYITGTSIEDVIAMENEKFRAVREVASSAPDCISDCCTASGLIRGLEADKAFCAEIEKSTGIRTISTLQSIVDALRTLKVCRIVITSPYPESMDNVEKSFFEANGFKVLKIKGLSIKDALGLALVPPNEIYRLCLDSWDKTADGLFISCMNFNPMPVIQALEQVLKVPVISSNTATLWKILRTLKIGESIQGYGQLLSEYIK